jgi:hypothetical protein
MVCCLIFHDAPSYQSQLPQNTGVTSESAFDEETKEVYRTKRAPLFTENYLVAKKTVASFNDSAGQTERAQTLPATKDIHSRNL